MPVPTLRRFHLVLAALALVAAVGRPASSKSWPTPALGPSKTGDPEVLFTFDDGPAPGLTDKVLETLEAHGVRAIFFLVGRRLTGPRYGEKGQELVDKMLAGGHLPANHTVDHVHLCRGKPDSAAWQLDEARRQIEKAAGMPVVLFRAPYGNRCKRLEEQLAARRITHTHWDIDPQEWKSHDAAATKAYVINKLKHLEGHAVILLHDIHGTTVKALPGILDWITQENQRREAKKLKPIRILDPADVVLERLAPDTLPLLEDVLSSARSFGPGLLRQTAPLSPPKAAASL